MPCQGADVIVSDKSCIPKPGAHVKDRCGDWDETGLHTNTYKYIQIHTSLVLTFALFANSFAQSLYESPH